MKKLIIYLSTFLLLFGASVAFAGVYIEDFEDGVLDVPDWYPWGDYVIEDETPDNKYLRMYHAWAPDPGDIPCSGVSLNYEELSNNEEFIYSFEVDLFVPEERYHRVSIGYQWEICTDPQGLICYGLQVDLTFGFYAEIGSFTPEGGYTLLGRVDLEPPANFGEWYHLSMALHDDHVTIGINGNERDLFRGLYYDPQSISYTSFTNNAGVAGCDWEDPNFVDVDYSVDNLVAYTSTGETIDEVLDSVEEWIGDGDLVGVGEGNSAAGRLNAFDNMLNNARDLFNAGDITGACAQLEDAYKKCDGQSPPPDFVEGDEVLAPLQVMITTLMTDFECQ